MSSSKEQIFREALARIGAGFYTEKGAEQHAKDILRLADSESAVASNAAPCQYGHQWQEVFSGGIGGDEECAVCHAFREKPFDGFRS